MWSGRFGFTSKTKMVESSVGLALENCREFCGVRTGKLLARKGYLNGYVPSPTVPAALHSPGTVPNPPSLGLGQSGLGSWRPWLVHQGLVP